MTADACFDVTRDGGPEPASKQLLVKSNGSRFRSFQSGLARQDVEDDGEVVADAPAEDEEVPDGVPVAQALRREEEDAGRVGHPARREPRERARGHEREYRLGRDDAQPAERDVGGDGHGPVARAEDEPEKYPRDRNPPSEPEERPAPSASQHEE